ncbi:sigma-70 family RNA polymerase sigma factor [uncultured Maricaulis sp.]|uniref:sigma-70 family RNA polymerase sigma factor n=1 Tax=uncultured Maricaulis sp. TaxID=174710 RepID=UPI0030D927FD|tara:strand:+ start:236560 stop:237090 length:531 start_codon:yes stop_codon:yes gene_type:complete
MAANSPDSHARQAVRDEIIALLPRLRLFARSLTRDAADADDLLQLTVERALVKQEQWTPGTRLDSWMYRIMKNIWIDEIRARTRRTDVFAPESAGEHVGAEDPHFEKRLRAMSVEQAMDTLPDEQRLAVGLVLVEGLSYREAAAVMDVPMGTLTSRLARGRAALEARLNPQEGSAS